MSSSETSKILVFILLFLPTVFFGVGIIPALFIIFGLFMMKKSEDFSHMDIANKNSRTYMLLVFTGCLLTMICGLYFGYQEFKELNNVQESFWGSLHWRYNEMIIKGGFLAGVALFYLWLLDAFFYKPLSAHRDWVEVNGVFPSKASQVKSLKEAPDVDIIKNEKLKSYSVADELLKWSKLKEEGSITEEDYLNAKKELLGK